MIMVCGCYLIGAPLTMDSETLLLFLISFPCLYQVNLVVDPSMGAVLCMILFIKSLK